MDDASEAVRNGACPHVDRNDQRCASRFRLGRIDQAFTVCFGSYHGCPMYHRINREDQPDGVDVLSPVSLTANGIRLRPTGS